MTANVTEKNFSFINRKQELDFLTNEYLTAASSFVIIYGRRRIGKTTLIKEFLKGKPAVYFLASDELESENINALKKEVARFTGSQLLERDFPFTWKDIFEVFAGHRIPTKRILVIDEFQYLCKINKSMPSIFQRLWDELLKSENIMLILCGSLVNMMKSETLDYSSPLYGRRTGQIKLKQVGFFEYRDFFSGKNLSQADLVDFYAVTGGVPQYIEIFRLDSDVFKAIKQNILDKQSFLYEEPLFLLETEVNDIGTYFSVIKTIAHGNHKLGKIASVLNVSQARLTQYLHTLMELDLVERIVPVTEANAEKSKKGLYYITDNFIDFWFKFVYPYRGDIEMGNLDYVIEKLEKNFIDNHTAFVFERVCLQWMWQLNKFNKLSTKFQRFGKWWNQNIEIDIVGLNEEEKAIVFGECKYLKKEVDIDLFYLLVEKAKAVEWKRGERSETYILFSKSGFSPRLTELATTRKDLQLISLQ